jgi:hypothetical protein
MQSKIASLAIVALATLIFACSKNDDKNPVAKPETIDNVSGLVSGIWKKGNTYKITNHIEIAKGTSLTIEEGVTVLFNDTTVRPEFIVKGNLYVYGTAANPVKFTVPSELKAANTWGRLWGGITAGTESEAIVLEYAELEYGGAVTTEESPSVKSGLYKAKAGEAVPAVWFGNPAGMLVVMNCKIHNFGEDGLYIDGGKLIVANNLFYTTGETGADAINIKSGTLIDAAFNIMFSPNTNAIKTSNSGDKDPQAYVKAYNNTIINAGWRRPTIKGGSIWVEKGVRAEFHNNLLANNRFGIKRDKKSPEDDRSVATHNFFYGFNQTCVDQFQPNSEILGGTSDVRGTKAGDNNPLFENFPLNTDMNSYTFNSSWDFHLKAGSPALSGAKTDLVPHFRTNGLTINGKTYTSPAPAAHFGAMGQKAQ